MKLLIAILTCTVLFGNGIEKKSKKKECIDMCKVKYIYANMLYGVDPDWDLFESCKEVCNND